VSNEFNNSTTSLKRPIDVAIWNIEYVLATNGADLMRGTDDMAFITASDEIFVANFIIFLVGFYIIGIVVKKNYLKMVVKLKKVEKTD
jgi:hypothetical protein